MDNYTFILLVVCAVLLVLLIVLVFVTKSSSEHAIRTILVDSEREKRRELDELKNQMQDDFNELKDRMNHELLMFQSSMMHSMREDINGFNESTSRKLKLIEMSMSDSLMKGFDRTSQSFASVAEQMGRIDEAQKHLKELSENIISLESILNDKKTRGIFGEIQLYSLLETVFGHDGQRYHKQVKLSNGSIADCIIDTPEPLGRLVIDSKFPLENYNRMVDEHLSAEEKKKAAQDFKKDVRLHIHAIAEKYLIPSETAEFACMFIPAESVFSTIVAYFDDLVQFSYAKKVYLVSPTTLMAYLSAIQSFYLNQQRSLKAGEIQQEVLRLSKEFERFVQRWQTVTKDFEKLSADMRLVDVTSDKIVKRFQQIEAVELSDDENPS